MTPSIHQIILLSTGLLQAFGFDYFYLEILENLINVFLKILTLKKKFSKISFNSMFLKFK
jgi:hypothetical protein